MPELVISDVEETVFARLRRQALEHGRTLEDEAKLILQEALGSKNAVSWGPVNALRERLAETGRHFSDSAELVREDRDR